MATIEAAFSPILTGCVIILMFATGILSEPSVLKNYFHGRRLQFTLRLIAVNTVIIPILTILLLYFIDLNPTVALLMFLLAIAPGAPMVPPLVYANRGDLNWSLVLTLSLTIISLFTIPVMLSFAHIYLNNKFTIPPITDIPIFFNYVVPIFSPLALGLLVKIYARRWAERSVSMLNKLIRYSNGLLLILVLAINYDQLTALYTSSITVLIPFVLACSFLARIAVSSSNTNRAQYVTAMITTGLRNFAIIVMLINLLSDDKTLLLQIVPVSVLPILFCFATGWRGSRNPQTATS